MNYILEHFNINLIIVGIVLLSGFFQKRYLCIIKISKNDSYDSAVKTLIVSLVACAIWIALDKSTLGTPTPWASYFISYFTATSLYELIIQPFSNWIKKITNTPTTDNEAA